MNKTRKMIAGLMIVLLIVIAILYSNKVDAHMEVACWSPMSPGSDIYGLWSANSDGSFTKISDNSGWIKRYFFQVYKLEQNRCPGEWIR